MNPLSVIPKKHRRIAIIAFLAAVLSTLGYVLSLGSTIGGGPSRIAYQNYLNVNAPGDADNSVILLCDLAKCIGSDQGSWHSGELRGRPIRYQRFLAMDASSPEDESVQAIPARRSPCS